MEKKKFKFGDTANTPKETVEFLDKYIVGQNQAKRCIAIALRNRWRRQEVTPDLRDEIMPKNIIMIGPTGVGKTEIARRIAKLVRAPFIKVEASKFTEVGYVGRDVESMIRDLMEISINMIRSERMEYVKEKAHENGIQKVVELIVPPSHIDEDDKENDIRDNSALFNKFYKKVQSGEMDDKMVEIRVESRSGGPSIDFFPISGNESIDINIKDMMANIMPKKTKNRKVKISEAIKIFEQEESEKLIDMDDVQSDAQVRVEQGGIIFLDEIDKIVNKHDHSGAEISREGVQRDLLPIVEGSTVNTKYGPVKTDHILFIAAGAFHLVKPSDLIPELQGRFPIRVELDSLTKYDFVRILTEPKNSLVKQYTALLKTEGVELDFQEDSIDEIAKLASDVNSKTENIGARRLHAILEKMLDEVSFEAPDMSGQTVKLTREYVQNQLGDIVKDQDLSRYIL